MTELLRDIRKATGPLARQIRMMISRCVLTLVDDSTPLQQVQVSLLAMPMADGSVGSEVADGGQVVRQYGFTAHPHPGAEGVYASVAGVRTHGLVVAVEDRRYRLRGLAAGEVALYDDLGQQVHLTRTGIVVKGAGLPITVTDTPKVRVEAARLEVTGDVIDHCDGQPHTVQNMREIYNGHKHSGVKAGGDTSATPSAEQ
jgi:phage baseplate assembly protein V